MASAIVGGIIGLGVGAVSGVFVAALRNEPLFGTAAGVGAALGVLGGAVVATQVYKSPPSSSGSVASTTGLPPEPGSTTPTVD